MLDPTGDIPWDEEVGSEDVVHIDSEQVCTDNYSGFLVVVVVVMCFSHGLYQVKYCITGSFY